MSFKLDNELSAVNTILGAIGQAPITQLEYENPEISFIHNLLQECNVDVQAEGWQFNTEYRVFFAPDSDGFIFLPKHTLRASLSQSRLIKNNGFNVTIRQNKLYDLTGHTFDFSDWEAQKQEEYKYTTEKGVNLDIVTLVEFEHLPAVVQRYITYRAAERAATQLVTNAELMQMIKMQTEYLRQSLIAFEADQSDANFMGYQDMQTYHTFNSFLPLMR